MAVEKEIPQILFSEKVRKAGKLQREVEEYSAKLVMIGKQIEKLHHRLVKMEEEDNRMLSFVGRKKRREEAQSIRERIENLNKEFVSIGNLRDKLAHEVGQKLQDDYSESVNLVNMRRGAQN